MTMIAIIYVNTFILWLVLITQYSSTLITENHKGASLTSVPEMVKNSVEYLILQENRI